MSWLKFLFNISVTLFQCKMLCKKCHYSVKLNGSSCVLTCKSHVQNNFIQHNTNEFQHFIRNLDEAPMQEHTGLRVNQTFCVFVVAQTSITNNTNMKTCTKLKNHHICINYAQLSIWLFINTWSGGETPRCWTQTTSTTSRLLRQTIIIDPRQIKSAVTSPAIWIFEALFRFSERIALQKKWNLSLMKPDGSQG